MFYSCEKDTTFEVVKGDVLSFTLEKVDPRDSYVSRVKSFTIKKRSAYYSIWYSQNWATISRKISFNVILENGREHVLDFEFSNHDVEVNNLDLPIIPSPLKYGDSWDYLDFDKEINDFYLKSAIYTVIDDYNYFFKQPNILSNDIFISNYKKVLQDGKEKTEITLKFSGETQQWYNTDPETKYRISDGQFTAIIE